MYANIFTRDKKRLQVKNVAFVNAIEPKIALEGCCLCT